MKRLLFAGITVALMASGCAVGDPKPATYVSDTSATLNGDVYSSVAGDTTYWFKYGTTTDYENESPHRTVAIADDHPHPVSTPLSILVPETEYHFQMCVQDEEEDPPREVCSKDRMFTTGPAGGRSGIAFASDRDGNSEIFQMSGTGANQTNVTNSSSYEFDPAWSPNGRQIAFTAERGDFEICTMDADGSNELNLTDNVEYDHSPAWSPDGSKIAFVSYRDGNAEIYVMDSDGGNPTNLTNNPTPESGPGGGYDTEPAWSPDGRRLAFTSDRDSLDSPGGSSLEIFVMDADGSNVTNISNSPPYNAEPAWSPDGSQLAFVSDRDEALPSSDIWVMDADGDNQRRLTTSPYTDWQPVWSRDGGRITFTADNSNRNQEIYNVQPDGDQLNNITHNPALDNSPARSPRPE